MKASDSGTKLRTARISMALLAAGLLWFLLLELIAPAPRYILHAKLDDYIPFLPAFIVPYAAWYLSCSLTGIFLFLRDREEFGRFAAFIAGGMLIACFIYTLWPNGQTLRPDLSGAADPFSAAVRLIYSIDTPSNSSPSLHVSHAVGVHIAVARYVRKRRGSRAITAASFALAVLIILSTVFIKQHSVLCIASGLTLALFLYLAVYGRQRARELRDCRATAVR